MNICIDIGHPAHVHYFKHMIWSMQGRGHSFCIVARDKEVAFKLLEYYNLPYHNRGKGRTGIIGKLLYIFAADKYIYKVAKKFKPDVFLSFGSPYAAHVAWFMRKPHVSFDDTDHTFFEHALAVPFTKTILTPEVYLKDFGSKQVRFKGFMELASLHPKRYKPNPEHIQKIREQTKGEKFVILRFVSWTASHDIGLQGLSLEDKYTLVKEISKYARVIISSEGQLPEDLQEYSYRVHPAFMHEFLDEASLIVSESLTMAAEAVFLGTPAVCMSTAKAGTLDEEVRLGLIELFRTSNGMLERVIDIVKQKDYKEAFKARTRPVVESHIDLSAFMIWFMENYPSSFETLKQQPKYQLNFI